MPALNREFTFDSSNEGKRADIALAELLSERFSRSQIKKMIDDGSITVNGRQISAHYHVKSGEVAKVEWGIADDGGVRAEDIPLDILYEDEDILLVDKPAGMVAHPAAGNEKHTLVNALLFHVKGLSSLGGDVRPGIVHRLDKETSGIMVIAKNDKAHAFMSKLFKKRTITRIYRVAVRGIVQHDEGYVEEPVGRAFLSRKKMIIRPAGGKDALTYFKVLKRYRKATLLEVRPHTGRTHQIRVHMRHMGHPVLGDALYGMATPGISRQAVHALAVAFEHPTTHKEVYFETQLPKDFEALLTYLESEE